MRRRRLPAGDAGSVLMLVPAAVLVLVVLGAIAVDSAIVFLAQRDLANRTAAVANDVAGFAAGDPALYGTGQVTLRPDLADEYARQRIAGAPVPAGVEWVTAGATVDGRQVEVWAEAGVRHLFARGVGDRARLVTVVRSVSRATAAETEP